MNDIQPRGLRIVNLKDFGAAPGSGRNCIEAVRRAARACHEQPGSVLLFPPGRYDLWDVAGLAEWDRFMVSNAHRMPDNYEPPPYGLAMDFQRCRDLVIDGQGSTLMIRGFTQPFRFADCENLVVKNLTIDWDRPPYSVGRVAAETERGLEVEVFEEFPVSDGVPIHIMQEYDGADGRPTPREWMGVQRTEVTGGRLLRITMGKRLGIAPGQLLVMRHPICCFWGLEMLRCDNLRVQNVTLHATPGIGMMIRFCMGVRLERITVAPRPGTRRIMSTNHDAIMPSGCGGVLELRDSLIAGMGDDGFGGGSGRVTVVQRLDNRIIEACFPNFRDFHDKPHSVPPLAGNHAEFTKLGTGVYGEAEIAEVEFDDAAGTMRLVFRDDVPKEVAPGDLFSEIERMPELRVTGCRFEPNRSRGVGIGRVQSALVEGNVFDRVGGSGIWMFQGYRGRCVGGVVIRNNEFNDCGHGVAHMGGNAVATFDHWYELPERFEGTGRVSHDILIEANRVRGTLGPAFSVCGVDGVKIRGNTFENPRPVIRLKNCGRVEVTGNTFTGGPAGAAVAVEGTCDRVRIEQESVGA